MIEVKWEWLSGKSKKSVLRHLLPKIEETMKNSPDLSVRKIARMYGIPKSSLYDIMSGNNKKRTNGRQ